jgi:hypothetical protein
VCGPYRAQQPTNAYPASEAVPAASAASIFPNRQRHLDLQAPATVESTYVLAEDPVIWYSGGQYHVLYDYPGDRVGYHLTSIDGVHKWMDRGLAYDPRAAQLIFSYTDGTVDHWFKMERPGVVLENGHVTYVTFAVSDVDKNNQIGAGSDHGSKVIVVPFNGAQLDCDIGTCDNAAEGGAPPVVDAGSASGGSNGGTTSDGAVSSGSSSGTSGGAAGTGSDNGTDSGSSGSADASTAPANGSSGCGCVGAGASTGAPGTAAFLAALGLWRWTRVRRRRE